MADNGAPTHPIINVVHPDADVSGSEPGMVWVHDEATGATTVQDAERYLWTPTQQPGK